LEASAKERQYFCNCGFSSAYQLVKKHPIELMETDPISHRAAEPTFDGEEGWETMEIQATLREWRRKTMAARPISPGGSVTSLPQPTELSSSNSPRRPKRHWWLFWRRRPA
jgi:hypothetical protein